MRRVYFWRVTAEGRAHSGMTQHAGNLDEGWLSADCWGEARGFDFMRPGPVKAGLASTMEYGWRWSPEPNPDLPVCILCAKIAEEEAEHAEGERRLLLENETTYRKGLPDLIGARWLEARE